MNCDLIEEAKSAPLPSPCLPSLLKLAAAEEVSFSELEAVIRRDPALMVRILKTANSAAYDGAKRITSLRPALLRIGQRKVVRWALAMSTAELNIPLPGYSICGSTQGLALLRANMAEVLSKTSGIGDPGTCYCAGLLAGVGKIALDPFLQGMDLGEQVRFTRREVDAAGADHAEVGAWMVARWGLPEEIAALIRHHHSPDHSDAPAAAAVLCLAEAMSESMLPLGLDAMANPPPPTISIGLDDELVERVCMDSYLAHLDFMEAQT